MVSAIAENMVQSNVPCIESAVSMKLDLLPMREGANDFD